MRRLLLASVLGGLVATLSFAPTPATAQPALVDGAGIIHLMPTPDVTDVAPVWLAGLALPPAVVTVRGGDTLSGLAARLARTWEQLAGFNRLADPNRLDVGQVLRIPPETYVSHMSWPTSNLWSALGVSDVSNAPSRSLPPVTEGRPPRATSSGSCYGLPDTLDVWTILNHESHCQTTASNGQYCGIGQLGGHNCQGGDGYKQAQAMTAYVMSRYGSWAAAAAHERAIGWY